MSLFPGFTQSRQDVNEVTINYRFGGSGEPVLLLHGYPQTHICWHNFAPKLAKTYQVVCPDLRGYGDSSKPAGQSGHSNYSNRIMADDMVKLMAKLGHDRFHVVSHDRGARVAHRMGIDHPEAVQTLTVMDISPTHKMLSNTDRHFAKACYHWYLMQQPYPIPETLLEGHVPLYLLGMVGKDEPDLANFDERAVAEYVRCYSSPEAVHASCEDYRASATIDFEHDQADKDAGRLLTMPVLTLWGSEGVVGTQFDCLKDWQEVAADVRGKALPCGHFLLEDAPDQTLEEVMTFLATYKHT